MISPSTFVFALVLVAAVNVALVLIIWSHLMRELHSSQTTTASSMRSLSASVAELKRAAPATIAAEVAELSEAVGKLRDIQRRFQGRFDQYVSGNASKEETPEEARARLRLQHGLPKIGGNP